MVKEIRFAGFGGQGVILAATVVGKAAAIYEGGYAALTQNFGPEARGGAASAGLILSDEPILYPYADHPDILVILSQEAYTRFSPELKQDGLLIVEEELVKLGKLPPAVRVVGAPATRLAEELGKKMVLNVVMVGFFAAVTGLLDKESYRKAIAATVPKAYTDLNLKAFERGYEQGQTAVSQRLAASEPPHVHALHYDGE